MNNEWHWAMVNVKPGNEYSCICENISNLSIEGIHVNYESSKAAYLAAKRYFEENPFGKEV